MTEPARTESTPLRTNSPEGFEKLALPALTSINIDINNHGKGLTATVLGNKLELSYPTETWRDLPTSLQYELEDHLAVCAFQSLPLMVGADQLHLSSSRPRFFSLLNRIEMHDLFKCEAADGVAPLEYLRTFWNQKITFNAAREKEAKNPLETHTPDRETVVLPFSFGKESLLTLGICLELGLEPILFYCEEPSHPHEGERKSQLIKDMNDKLGIQLHELGYTIGGVRYGHSLDLALESELGWGLQTTTLALLAIPFALQNRAATILFGNEAACNSHIDYHGWHSSPLYEQSSDIVEEIDHMISTITYGQTNLASSLEPFEQIAILALLYARYPELTRYHYSCETRDAHTYDSNWCHCCYKCERIFIYAQALGIDTESMGFQEDLLQKEGRFANYFEGHSKIGPVEEMDLAFHLLHARGVESPYVRRFYNEKLSSSKPLPELIEHYFSFQTDRCTPDFLKNGIYPSLRTTLEQIKKELLEI